jgi:hypothetical protein
VGFEVPGYGFKRGRNLQVYVAELVYYWRIDEVESPV